MASSHWFCLPPVSWTSSFLPPHLQQLKSSTLTTNPLSIILPPPIDRLLHTQENSLQFLEGFKRVKRFFFYLHIVKWIQRWNCLSFLQAYFESSQTDYFKINANQGFCGNFKTITMNPFYCILFSSANSIKLLKVFFLLF